MHGIKIELSKIIKEYIRDSSLLLIESNFTILSVRITIQSVMLKSAFYYYFSKYSSSPLRNNKSHSVAFHFVHFTNAKLYSKIIYKALSKTMQNSYVFDFFSLF